MRTRAGDERQEWRRIGHLIVLKPYWRKNRTAWYVRTVNTLNPGEGRRAHRVDLPNLTPSQAERQAKQARRSEKEFEKVWQAAIATVTDVAHVESLSTANLFEKAVEEFLTYKKPDLRANSYRDLELALRSFAKGFQGRLVESIPSVEVEAVIRSRTWRGEPITQRTRTRLCSHLHSFFTWAVRHGLCKENPVAAMDIKGGADRKPNTLAFTESEARALLAAASERGPCCDLRVFLAVGFLSGIRPEGIARLRWKDIRFEEQTIVLPSEASKTHTEVTLPLHSALGAFLREALAARMPVLPDDRIVATTIRTLLVQFQKLIVALSDTVSAERAELLTTATLRTCRRSFASWIEPVAPFATLQALMGHKQGAGSVTARYVVPKLDAMREAVEKLPRILPPLRTTAALAE